MSSISSYSDLEFDNNSDSFEESDDEIQTFEILDKNHINEKISTIVDKFSSFLPDLTQNMIILFLNKYNWDIDRLSEDYLDNPDKVLGQLNLILNTQPDDSIECQICYSDNVKLLPNPICNHKFCQNCYLSNIKIKILEENTYSIPCMNLNCKSNLDFDFLYNLIKIDGNEKLKQKLKSLITEDIVQNNPQTAWCCTNSCEAIIWVNNTALAKKSIGYFKNTDIYKVLHCGASKNLIYKSELKSLELKSKRVKVGNEKTSCNKPNNVVLNTTLTIVPERQISKTFSNPPRLKINCTFCQNEICFNCSKLWHDPINCEYLAKWELKCTDESETLNWMQLNTRNCPKCQVNIEKNDGCNHMTCRNKSCNYEFCWLCLGEWKLHGSSYFKCDKMEREEKENKISKKIEKIEREKQQAIYSKYVHCLGRFSGHEKSLKFENILKDKIEDKRKQFIETLQLSSNETDFMKIAVNTLCACRRTIMYCYVFHYYSVNSGKDYNHELFSDNLNDLHVQVENLSNLLSKQIDLILKPSIPVVKKSNISNKQQNTLYKNKIQPNFSYSESTQQNKFENYTKVDVERISKLYKDIKSKIINQERYCKDRRTKLISHVEDGYKENIWTFFD